MDDMTLEQARKIVKDADKGSMWPIGSNLISKANYNVVLDISGFTDFGKDNWRELTSTEMELLKQIPEFAEAMK